MIILAGSMAVCGHTWCWIKSWEFYNLILRQPGRDCLLQTARKGFFPHWVEFKHKTSRPTSTATYLLQQGHTHSYKATPPNSVTSPGPINPHTHFNLSLALCKTVVLHDNSASEKFFLSELCSHLIIPH